MPSAPDLKFHGLDSWRREAMRVVLAMSTAAGTVYASVRTALNDHENRIGDLESRQAADEQKAVSREEIEAHWTAITAQLNRIDQDIRDLRFEVRSTGEPNPLRTNR
jgi:hypothetical protein